MLTGKTFAALAACCSSFAGRVAAVALDARSVPVLAARDAHLYERATPMAPSQGHPGDSVRYRPTSVLEADLPLLTRGTGLNYSASYQYLYRTTDSLGNATAAVTTLIVPQNADWDRLVSYQIPYDAPNVNCGPSYTLQGGGFNLADDIPTLLSQGWYVNTPDYEGPKAAFTAGVISGKATLDSIRAVLKTNGQSGICPTAKVAMWGYSGGALASEWATELQHKYAPDLKFVGAALGGLTPNVTSVAIAVNNHTLAGLIPAGILGLSAAYPNLSEYVSEKILPSKRDAFYGVLNDCIAQEVVGNHDIDFSTYFVDGFADLTSPLATSVINAGGIMGLHGKPHFPLYVYKSVFDEVSPVNDTDALVDKYCKGGARINYVRFNYGNHLEAAGDGEPGALAFLKSVLSGVKQPAGCNITTVPAPM